MRWGLWLVLTLVLWGCDRHTGTRGLSDYELSERHTECLERQPTAPGEAQACENIRKECDRRKRELGLYLCTNY